MVPLFASWLSGLDFRTIDEALAAAISACAVAIVVSGVDDLVLNAVCAWHWCREKMRRAVQPDQGEGVTLPPRRMAIFVPCWKESGVITHMVEHNVSAIHYPAYDFFIGAYPNDEPTLDAVRDLESRFANVHLAVCAHDGPTSKADCLNWVYQRMLLYEESQSVRFDVVLTHDAEDLVHPESLTTINWYIGDYDMVQIPVLPLPTPFWDLTHGVYCDEFSEFQIKDMRARGLMRSFIPSNGVGTGYSRAALQKIAESESNRIFDPVCLTEDYENGMRLHRMGCRQLFVPLRKGPTGFVATREFFPRDRRIAIRQRTRWVTGIALQTWERHGWRGALADKYWFWRDRKGLIGNPLSFLTNLLFVAGGISWAYAHWFGHVWALGNHGLPRGLLQATLLLQVLHLSVRMTAVAKVYGWLFALGVPVRVVFGNYINATATCKAIFRYFQARIRDEPLVWVKTEHAYPSRTALLVHKRRLGEILVGSGYIGESVLEGALATQPPGIRIGEHLVQLGAIREEDLYEALSLQQSVPSGRLEVESVSRRVARALPRRVMEKWKVLPYRVAAGSLFLASPEIPTDELNLALRGFTRMQLRFQLVTPGNFEELCRTFL